MASPCGVTLEEMLAEETVSAAHNWLCAQRKNYPQSADIWSLRRNWERERQALAQKLRAGAFRFRLLTRLTLQGGEEIDLWCARDALVLKCLALVLLKHLPRSPRCFHAKSTPEEKKGAKPGVRNAFAHLAKNRFVLKADVKSYYASIDHQAILDHLAPFIRDRPVWNLLVQYLKRCSERGGLFWEFTRGIALGCPLSPVLGSFFLDELDRGIEKSGLFYIRFMDDILVLAPTRWKLRRAVKTVSQALDTLLLQKQPEKTFTGKVEKGFDFLGYHFRPGRLEVSAEAKRRFVEHARRLCEREQGQSDPLALLGEYVRRWNDWAAAGLHDLLPAQDPCP